MSLPVGVRRRRSIRMPKFDYASGGVFFVTICVKGRECLFGEVVECQMRLNEAGRLAVDCWESIAVHRRNVELDTYVVMPNHVHGLLRVAPVGATLASPSSEPALRVAHGPPPNSIGAIVGAFKADVSRRMNRLRLARRHSVWQRDYHDHLVRNDRALDRIRNYIAANPARWSTDPENPERVDDGAAAEGDEQWCV